MKENKKYRYIGIILYYVLRVIAFTIRVKVINKDNIDINKQYIYCFWHSKLILPTIFFKNIEKKVALSSPSKDGELISVPLEKLGYSIVRGSSDKESVASTIKLLKYIKKGYSMGTPIDGPKGPREKVKKGLLYLAQKTSTELIPIGISYEKKWILNKTWDKFEIPVPFSKVILVIGKPMKILEEDNLDSVAECVESKINDMNKVAISYLKEKENE